MMNDKVFEALRNLERVSKNSEIIIQRVIGVYMGGGVQVVPHKTNIYNEYKNDFETIKQTLTTKSKKEQALEIIVKKIWRLKDHKKCIYGTYENYVSDFKRRYEGNLTRYRKYELTQEEYDLLKEVLKNE